jgi:D-Tyr-tRNAtyr deacylase
MLVVAEVEHTLVTPASVLEQQQVVTVVAVPLAHVRVLEKAQATLVQMEQMAEGAVVAVVLFTLAAQIAPLEAKVDRVL